MPFVRDEDAPPGGVTVVAALAIVEMCAGVVLIVLSGSVHGYSTASAIAVGIATLIALILNLMVFVVLWSARSSFGAGSDAGGGPGPMQPA